SNFLRLGRKGLGFNAEIEMPETNIGDVLAKIMPEDLLKFGLIPEFVGRLPILVTLDALDEPALVQILTEPRNALVKQYQKMLTLDNVELEFKDEAVRAVAREAMRRNTGARALRAIIEDIMLNVMYDIPSRTDIAKCIITQDVVEKHDEPLLVTQDRAKRGKKQKEETA
ncbi:MAG: ATP-dependent Clp protease ATP-binding subunit ClpX, partial [Firmicutes bacterium]|nr:ATP-dependent Clp protease ATP-binding subunit ClpX [Bacillota bacterium]